MKNKTKWLLGMVVLVGGCGVKGNPEPPDTPPRLGRGQPTYEKATREFAFPDLPPAQVPEDDADKDDE